MPMQADKQEVLKRLNYIEGHLGGIRKMIEEDKYCVDILRQTYAVRKAIEKLEGLLVESHLHTCVPEGIASGKSETMIEELVQLYNQAGDREDREEKNKRIANVQDGTLSVAEVSCEHCVKTING